jgi:hypothetical protein
VPLPQFPLDGYIMLFEKDGDLNFQDGTNTPFKVTHVGDAHYSYRLSDDNQKVALIAPGFAFGNLGYSINTDGTQKKPLLPVSWPDNNLLWGTHMGKVDFVPGTHQLIFSTHSCNSDDNSCVSSIFLINSDAGEIKKLADLGFSGPLPHENFLVSPNGKMVAVMTTSSVNILDLNGRVIRQDILFFRPNTPQVLFPMLFWFPDSSGLIAGLPTTLFDTVAYDYISASTVWRYTISDNLAVRIPLDPPPPLDTFQVSPDGKWIVYGGFSEYDSKVYVGDLANGHTKIFGDATQVHFSWGPDSKHFIATSAGSLLGAIDVPILTPVCQSYGGWIDANHFTCGSVEGKTLRKRMAEIDGGGVKIYNFGFDKDVEASLFIKPKR